MTDIIRIQMDFGPDNGARLDRLRDLTAAGSYSEVIVNALKLYEGVINEGGQHARLIVQKDDGTTALIRVFT